MPEDTFKIYLRLKGHSNLEAIKEQLMHILSKSNELDCEWLLFRDLKLRTWNQFLASWCFPPGKEQTSIPKPSDSLGSLLRVIVNCIMKQ